MTSLPTTENSVVMQTPTNLEQFVDRGPMTAVLKGGRWVSAANWKERLYPEAWVGGWVLVHEAESSEPGPTDFISAVVEGVRRQGFLDNYGDFQYFLDSGQSAEATRGDFTDVHPLVVLEKLQSVEYIADQTGVSDSEVLDVLEFLGLEGLS